VARPMPEAAPVTMNVRDLARSALAMAVMLAHGVRLTVAFALLAENRPNFRHRLARKRYPASKALSVMPTIEKHPTRKTTSARPCGPNVVRTAW